MKKGKDQSPKVWKSLKPKVKAKKVKTKKLKKGKLTFFKITGAGELDFLLSPKMLKHRRKCAKALHQSAKKQYDKAKKNLANIGTQKKSTTKIKQLERKLVVAKMVKAQTKEFFLLAKADCKKFKK